MPAIRDVNLLDFYAEKMYNFMQDWIIWNESIEKSPPTSRITEGFP